MYFAIAIVVVLVVLILCLPALMIERVDDPQPEHERRAHQRQQVDPHKVEYL